MIDEIKLEDFIPQTVNVKIKSISHASGDDLIIKPITINDEAWIRQTFTDEQLEKIFKLEDKDSLMKLFYKLLDPSSKKLVASIKLEDFDELGKPINFLNISMPDKLKYLVGGIDELVAIYESLLKARGLSAPILRKMADEELKKKMIQNVQMTGEKSLIQSQVNMDTHGNNLEV